MAKRKHSELRVELSLWMREIGWYRVEVLGEDVLRAVCGDVAATAVLVRGEVFGFVLEAVGDPRQVWIASKEQDVYLMGKLPRPDRVRLLIATNGQDW